MAVAAMGRSDVVVLAQHSGASSDQGCDQACD